VPGDCRWHGTPPAFGSRLAPDNADPEEQRALLRTALIELGALPRSDEQVGERLFQVMANRIVEGSVTPLQGARELWPLEIDYGVALPGAMSQCGALHEDDFRSSDIKQGYERDIREATARWLDANPG
jgi:hypothetical protein